MQEDVKQVGGVLVILPGTRIIGVCRTHANPWRKKIAFLLPTPIENFSILVELY